MGHEIKGCWSLELMHEQTLDSYIVQVVEVTQKNQGNNFLQGNYRPHNFQP